MEGPAFEHWLNQILVNIINGILFLNFKTRMEKFRPHNTQIFPYRFTSIFGWQYRIFKWNLKNKIKINLELTIPKEVMPIDYQMAARQDVISISLP